MRRTLQSSKQKKQCIVLLGADEVENSEQIYDMGSKRSAYLLDVKLEGREEMKMAPGLIPSWTQAKSEKLPFFSPFKFFLSIMEIAALQGLAGEGHGNPLQCSCLENPMDRGAWWATVHGVTKSRT